MQEIGETTGWESRGRSIVGLILSERQRYICIFVINEMVKEVKVLFHGWQRLSYITHSVFGSLYPGNARSKGDSGHAIGLGFPYFSIRTCRVNTLSPEQGSWDYADNMYFHESTYWLPFYCKLSAVFQIMTWHQAGFIEVPLPGKFFI